MTIEQLVALIIFITCFSLLMSRKIKIMYVSLVSALVLIVLGIVGPWQAISKSINWDVLGIYWGFGMLAIVFSWSKVPTYISFHIIKRAKREKYAIFYLCALAAFLSAFMPNPIVVMMLAPIAIEITRRLKSSLFVYLVAVAISSNIVTTVTMVADPPAIILAMKTGMKFFDFYWFQGKIGLGVISAVGAVAALLSLLLLFRNMNKEVKFRGEVLQLSYAPTMLFASGVLALAFVPISPGITSLCVGIVALLIGRKMFKTMFKEFDWDSFFFVIGIFVVVSSLEITGLLGDFANWFLNLGINDATVVLAILVWVSVALSSFIDNVPYTLLMIPVCIKIAAGMGVSPFPFLFGMLIGTGIGGNITPVGATSNVIACGILEKHGYKINLKEYLKISLISTVIAVAAAHILLQIVWM